MIQRLHFKPPSQTHRYVLTLFNKFSIYYFVFAVWNVRSSIIYRYLLNEYRNFCMCFHIYNTNVIASFERIFLNVSYYNDMAFLPSTPRYIHSLTSFNQRTVPIRIPSHNCSFSGCIKFPKKWKLLCFVSM